MADSVEAEVDLYDVVVARVRNGRDAFQVRIARDEADPQLALVACTCGIAANGIQRPCKHVYATLLAVDEFRVARDGAAPRRVRVCAVDDEQLLIVGAARPVGAPPPPTRRSLVEPKDRLPTWRVRRQGLTWPQPRTRAMGPTYPIEFVVRATTPAVGGGETSHVTVVMATVRTAEGRSIERRDGPLGACLDSPRDRNAVDALLGVQTLTSEAGTPSAIGARVSPSRMPEVMNALSASGKLGWLPRGTSGPLSPLRWDGQTPYTLTIALAREEATGDSVVARALLVRDTERIPVDDVEAVAGGGLVIVGERLLRLEPGGVFTLVWSYLRKGGVTVMRDSVREFLNDACMLSEHVGLDLSALGWTVERMPPTCRISLLLESARGAFSASTDIRYDSLSPTAKYSALIFDESRLRVLRRDTEREIAAREQLRRLGFSADDERLVAVSELAAFVETASSAGWEVWCERRRVVPATKVSARVTSAMDWFDLAVDVEGPSGAKADVGELLAALGERRSMVRLSDGTALALPMWLRDWLDVLRSGKEKGGVLRFGLGDALAIGSLLERVSDVRVDDGFRRLQRRIEEIHQVPSDPPRGFRGQLLPYQREGLGWLKYLRELQLGGCLADDMGLGKTVQVLAFLLDVHTGSWSRRPSLVVAPRSVVFQWLAEATKFAPSLRVTACVDAASVQAACAGATTDVVLTTYGMVRTQQRALQAREFEVVVLDEAHTIKTETAETTRACCALRASQRLALTGTPVENRLEDLQSIFGFLNPGILARPTAVAALAESSELDRGTALGSVLRPLILRRTKTDVNAQLVPKQVIRVDCTLAPLERERYDALRAYYRDHVRKNSTSGAVWKALAHLRQATLHPGLLDGARRSEHSSKLTMLVQRLARIVDTGECALVFSQYTRLLSIVREHLDARGIGHEYLDGATVDRERRIDRFQRGAVPVFLISLKAGGTGLNLTAANHVFLLDPWWNPAVEDQAIDRVHRPGQTRAVSAYRLVSVDTIEDKVLALQQHKRQLFTSVFGSGAAAKGTLEQLRQLLE